MNLTLIAEDGTQLDLNPGTVVQVNFFNSIFSTEVLRGSYTYTFALPMSPVNKLFFGFSDHINSLATYQKEYTGFKFKSGIIEMPCTLSLDSISSEGFNVSLYLASGAVADKLKEKLLTDITTETIEVKDEIQFAQYRLTFNASPVMNEYLYATVRYESAGPTYDEYVYGIEYTGQTESQLMLAIAEQINTYRPIQPYNASTNYMEYDLALDTATDDIYASDQDNNLGNTFPGTTWLFLCSKNDWPTKRAEYNSSLDNRNWWKYDLFLANKGFRAYSSGNSITLYEYNAPSYTLNFDSFNQFLDQNNDVGVWAFLGGINYTYPTANIFNDYLAIYLTKKVNKAVAGENFIAFPYLNPTFSPHPDYCGIVNYWKNGGFFGNDYDFNDFQTYAHSISINALYTIQKLHNYLSNEFDADADMPNISDNNFIIGLYLFSNYSADRFTKFNSGGWKEADLGANILNLSQYLPPITLGDFLNGFRNYFFLGIFFDFFSTKVKYRKLADVLSDFANAIDLTAEVGPFQEIVYENPKGFFLQYSHDPGDDLIGKFTNDIYNNEFTLLTPVANFASLPASPDENDLCLVINEDQYYLAVQINDGTIEWQYFSKNLYGLKLPDNDGNSVTIYQPKASTTLMYNGHDWLEGPRYFPAFFIQNAEITYRVGDFVLDENGDYYECLVEHNNQPLSSALYWALRNFDFVKMPMSSISRNSKTFKEKTKCTLRFLYYAGMVQPLAGNEIQPHATNDAGTLGTLKWEGNYGLYNLWGKEWIEFVNKRKRTTVQLPMNETLLQELRPDRLIKIHNQFYLYSEIKASFPMENGLATLTLYSIN
jgi:hypothetical protein